MLSLWPSPNQILRKPQGLEVLLQKSTFNNEKCVAKAEKVTY